MFETRPRIRLLPESLINQIAAGEVVERPAAVLKELVENSLDAGAHRVEIECEQAGMRLIRVRDDGHGIAPEDLALALCRHATSKISRIDDLDRIASMGFRGEALPSIGAVSRLTLVSRANGADSAWQAGLEGRADVSGPAPASHPVGTTVEVRDLFFNTPARRRFLRSERTELLHIQQAVRNLALGRPEIGIRLAHNRQTLMQLPPAGDAVAARARLARLYGAAFEQSALPIAAEAGGLRASGWISPPASARNQSDLQSLFVNGRPIRDQGLQHAIRLAYEDRLPAGRFPAYVIHLSVPAEQVDINVHPAKSEVRFREPRQVHDFLLSVLRNHLSGGGLVAAPTTSSVPVAAADLPADAKGRVPPAPVSVRTERPGVRDARADYRPEPVFRSGSALPDAMARERVLDLFDRRFAVVRAEDALMIVDLAQAYAALNRERLLACLGDSPAAGRPLLFPLAAEVPAVDASLRERSLQALAQLGFDLQWQATGDLLLRGVPAALVETDPEDLLAVLAQVLPDVARAPDSNAWITRLADAIPMPRDCRPQNVLDEVRRRGIDTTHCQRRFNGEQLSRLLSSST